MVYVAPFVVTVLVIIVLNRCAGSVGLSVEAGGHRSHEGKPTLVGGVGMFIGLTCGLVLTHGSPVLWICMFLVVAAGIWDDIHELSTSSRFIAQVAAAVIMIYWGDVVLFDLGYLVSDESLFYLGRWAVALSIFGSVGLMNAINMSDGMDGLAGSLTFVSASAILIAALVGEAQQTATEIGILMSVIAAFLLFNIRLTRNKPARVFMGDAGSMMLGLSLAWYVIKHSQEPDELFTPVTALWIVALPLFDTVAVLFRRVSKGQSPFSADRNHFHHYLLEMGLSVNQALAVGVGVALICAFIGLTTYYAGISERFMFNMFLLLFLVYLVAMEVAQRKLGL